MTCCCNGTNRSVTSLVSSSLSHTSVGIPELSASRRKGGAKRSVMLLSSSFGHTSISIAVTAAPSQTVQSAKFATTNQQHNIITHIQSPLSTGLLLLESTTTAPFATSKHSDGGGWLCFVWRNNGHPSKISEGGGGAKSPCLFFKA